MFRSHFGRCHWYMVPSNFAKKATREKAAPAPVAPLTTTRATVLGIGPLQAVWEGMIHGIGCWSSLSIFNYFYFFFPLFFSIPVCADVTDSHFSCDVAIDHIWWKVHPTFRSHRPKKGLRSRCSKPCTLAFGELFLFFKPILDLLGQKNLQVCWNCHMLVWKRSLTAQLGSFLYFSGPQTRFVWPLGAGCATDCSAGLADLGNGACVNSWQLTQQDGMSRWMLRPDASCQ